MEFDAIVLAGGRGSRLGGADKALLEVDGVSLLDRALAAVADAHHVVVVGDEHPTAREVRWVRERPAYGGPVAAAYAGLEALSSDTTVGGLVVVLAVDMPGVTAATVRRLVTAVDTDGAVLMAGGRRHLAFAARAQSLARIRPEVTDGVAMRTLWAGLELTEVLAVGGEADDIDSPADLHPGS